MAQKVNKDKLVISSRQKIDPVELFDKKEISEIIQELTELDNILGEEVYVRFRVPSYKYGGANIYLEKFRYETEQENLTRLILENKELEKQNKKQKSIEAKERNELQRLLNKYGQPK